MKYFDFDQSQDVLQPKIEGASKFHRIEGYGGILNAKPGFYNLFHETSSFRGKVFHETQLQAYIVYPTNIFIYINCIKMFEIFFKIHIYTR